MLTCTSPSFQRQSIKGRCTHRDQLSICSLPVDDPDHLSVILVLCLISTSKDCLEEIPHGWKLILITVEFLSDSTRNRGYSCVSSNKYLGQTDRFLVYISQGTPIRRITWIFWGKKQLHCRVSPSERDLSWETRLICGTNLDYPSGADKNLFGSAWSVANGFPLAWRRNTEWSEHCVRLIVTGKSEKRQYIDLFWRHLSTSLLLLRRFLWWSRRQAAALIHQQTRPNHFNRLVQLPCLRNLKQSSVIRCERGSWLLICAHHLSWLRRTPISSLITIIHALDLLRSRNAWASLFFTRCESDQTFSICRGRTVRCLQGLRLA